MKKLLFLLVILFPVCIYAQYAGGTFSGKNYVLSGESEIILKNGESVTCKDKIDGTKLGKTDIDYKDVDYIRLIKTNMSGFSKANGTTYKYVNIKNKPRLVLILAKSPKVSFYKERPKMTGGGYNAIGHFQPHGETYKVFMVKNGEENAQEVDFGKNMKNIAKIFPDCPRLIQYQKIKELRSLLSLQGIAYIYNNNCSNASPEDIKSDTEAISKIILEKYDKANK